MNSLPNHTSATAGGADQRIVSLLVTETTVLTKAESNSPSPSLPLEQAMQQRAAAMTDVLSEIMERPITPRFWGLNE
jgi:hypothetical protein